MSAAGVGLARALGRRDLTLFAVNRIIGGGIFGLPAVLYASVGPWSVGAMVLAGVVVLGVALCFAEVGSRYTSTGGPYLYAFDAFGPATGFVIGWLMWVAQLGGYAAVTNLFVNYGGWLQPGMASGPGRVVTILAVTALLTAVNVAGVRDAARTNNALTVAKLVPLALFILVGGWFVSGELLVPAAAVQPGPMVGAVLLAIYAYSGFEVVGVPTGEMREPARTIPFALLVGLGLVAAVYVGVQVVAVGTLPDLGGSTRPLADAAERVAGRAGALLMVTGAMLSTFGVAHAILLGAGRMPFAMAERGQLPPAVAAVHPRFQTPHVALLVSAACMALFTLATTFVSAVTITVALRVLVYAVTCLALPTLRRQPGRDAPPFRAPGGSALALACAAVSVALLASRPAGDIIQLLAVVGCGILLWVWSRRLGGDRGGSASR